MASEADHLVQARGNRDHAEWLLASRPDDPFAMQWAVTAAFYAALHGLTAHLMGRGVAASTHDERGWALADPRNGVPPHVYTAYRLLEGRGKQARYLLRRFSSDQVRALLDGPFAEIWTFLKL